MHTEPTPRPEPVVEAFIELSQGLRWSSVDPATRAMLRRELLDYFGAAVAGRAAVGIPAWLKVLIDCGGRADAHVLGGRACRRRPRRCATAISAMCWKWTTPMTKLSCMPAPPRFRPRSPPQACAAG